MLRKSTDLLLQSSLHTPIKHVAIQLNTQKDTMRSMTFAYLDPGTGSLVLQLLVGGVAGLLTFARFRWGVIKGWFSRGERADR